MYSMSMPLLSLFMQWIHTIRVFKMDFIICRWHFCTYYLFKFLKRFKRAFRSSISSLSFCVCASPSGLIGAICYIEKSTFTNSNFVLPSWTDLFISLLFGHQISASLDALIDVSGGKVNIHVLMALAAFASVFMGNPLEGGLLIAMFNLAHIGRIFF